MTSRGGCHPFIGEIEPKPSFYEAIVLISVEPHTRIYTMCIQFKGCVVRLHIYDATVEFTHLLQLQEVI